MKLWETMGNYGNSITVTIINASKKVEHLETSEWYTLKSATNRILQLIFLENEALKKKMLFFLFGIFYRIQSTARSHVPGFQRHPVYLT